MLRLGSKLMQALATSKNVVVWFGEAIIKGVAVGCDYRLYNETEAVEAVWGV